jgi:hypothetical protein
VAPNDLTCTQLFDVYSKSIAGQTPA